MTVQRDFIAKGVDFGRALNLGSREESQVFDIFPNAKHASIKYYGQGNIRPNEESCSKYDCFIGKVSIYQKNGELYFVFAKNSQVRDESFYKLSQFIWDLCASDNYYCKFGGPFGATFNCIGWALGISKWINANEVEQYNNKIDGYFAVKRFVDGISELYGTSSINIIDPIIYNLQVIPQLKADQHLENNTVVFYFGKDGNCLHASRYVISINENEVNSWTSKLGGSILIGHAANELAGDVYGEPIIYAIHSNASNVEEFEILHNL